MENWRVLHLVLEWERINLPRGDRPEGREILSWLLMSGGKRQPLNDLYDKSDLSEPTLRNCLRVFTQVGLVVIEVSAQDKRTRYAFTTPKFRELMIAYYLLLQTTSLDNSETPKIRRA